MRRIAGILSVAVLLCTCLRGDGAPTAPVGKATRSDLALRALLDGDQPGCSASVGIEGKVVWSGALGVADLGTGAKLATDTVFDIGSVSKQFTATVILLLAIDGRLSIQEPIAQYLPALPDWAGRVRITDLIHHT